MGGQRLNKPIVTMAATPSGKGYWLVASDGGVFAFGDAGFFGSTGGIALQKPIVTMAVTPSGKGYWLVASDGGVFAFGDARFFGSTGGRKLVKPVVGMAGTATGNGYWLVASDGGIFTFGDANFYGSTGAVKLKAPVVGMAATPGGRGYWMAASDGGIFAFGDAPFAGSVGGVRLAGPVVSMATTPRGLGYWLVGSDGGIFSFGDAGFAGSLGGVRLAAPIVALAPRPATIPAEVSIFFYPWYSKPGVDLRAGWRHWEQNGHTPPSDIGANFYPADGLYSSLDPDVLLKQARQMAASGVDTVVSSWWGIGGYEDWMLPDLVAAVRAAGLRLAIHLEPYKGRTPATVAGDLAYLRGLGITDVYVYQADKCGGGRRLGAGRGRSTRHALLRREREPRLDALRLLRRIRPHRRLRRRSTPTTRSATAPPRWPPTCAAARQRRLLCSPSVSPGFDARRAGFANLGVVPALGGERYDSTWRSAFAAGADVVSITSWNEWHEGTQIEPAKPYCFPSDGYCSPGYDGAYGRFGTAAYDAYMDRTVEWVRDFRTLRAGP